MSSRVNFYEKLTPKIWISTARLSEKNVRIATAKREKHIPTLEQIKHVIAAMPANTEIEKRNRALVAFTILIGARDSAIASMKLKHIDLSVDKGRVEIRL